MPIVQAKCEGCGGILEVDSSLKAAICKYCGSAYVVQDAINNYNSVTNVEYLHANVVNVIDDSSSKARLEAADTYLKLGKYDDAYKEYNTVSKLTPQDYRSWWGMVVAKTDKFTRRIRSESELSDCREIAKSIELLSTGNSVLLKWKEYDVLQQQLNREELEELLREERILEDNLISAKEELQSIANEIKLIMKEKDSLNRGVNPSHNTSNSLNRAWSSLEFLTIAFIVSLIVSFCLIWVLGLFGVIMLVIPTVLFVIMRSSISKSKKNNQELEKQRAEMLSRQDYLNQSVNNINLKISNIENRIAEYK